ncbi:16S rRNA (uracil(1498)-N(3))-methyltransferase [Schaalia odontolytica]|uniref:Ribosomal RNA small subunit methyltransferase E n=1 Tax=Schaalia odontolytica TaxID=1660 RepID=A0A2X0VM37_9ACTO|nr:16S rRNA (uracil(1498)-N(3))-methyltransferase [Schaalia odontolytica]WMS27630.1 16S rRNA (uracil(1498)-N(3))-methyltransferase [Schaalia odontolytica]SPT54841.1 Ribosomal RNA small subunit methyltransferase E [Schaalia odontolytica]
MTLPVFLSEDLTPSIDTLSVGETVTLAGAEGRHAASVRRIGAGEWVDVVDGFGLRATCEVSGSDKSSLSLVVRELVQEEAPRPEIVLVQALAKGGRDEAAVEICTEIGIDRVIPWASQRAIVQWKGPKADKGRAKWEGVARAAAKQSRRAFVPVVEEVKDSSDLATWICDLTDEAGVAFVCHEEATVSLGVALARIQQACGGALPARIALIVGPEGGIGEHETARLVDAGASTIGLGDNVLRSSTAGAVALTLIRAAAGKY